MKKRVSFLMIFLLALLLTGCSEKSGGSTQYQVYYISTSGTKLVEESYMPESSTSPREVTEELLEKMGRPQVGSDHVKALPDEVKVEHCLLKAREVDVDFNEAYNDMDPVREILVRAAFVNTLIQVSNVEQVVITVNGEDLVDEAGDVVGGMTAESFIDTKGDGINSYQNATLSLYFADSDGSLIEREMRNVHYSSNSTLEKVILEELIKGPVNEKLQAVLPAETKVLSVQTEGGTCTVNFDSAFNAAPSSESNVTAETSLYAAVDALIDTAGVREVIIQIEGSQETLYRDEIDLTQPFTKREDLIYDKTTASLGVFAGGFSDWSGGGEGNSCPTAAGSLRRGDGHSDRNRGGDYRKGKQPAASSVSYLSIIRSILSKTGSCL